MLKLVRE